MVKLYSLMISKLNILWIRMYFKKLLSCRFFFLLESFYLNYELNNDKLSLLYLSVKDINHLLRIVYYGRTLIEYLIQLSYSLPLQLSCYWIGFHLYRIICYTTSPSKSYSKQLDHIVTSTLYYFFFFLIERGKRRIITNVG